MSDVSSDARIDDYLIDVSILPKMKKAKLLSKDYLLWVITFALTISLLPRVLFIKCEKSSDAVIDVIFVGWETYFL